MKNSKLWNIGLSLFLMAATIVGCSSDSSSSGSYSPPDSSSSESYSPPDSSGTSSDSSASTDSTQQSTSSASDALNREDGVVIKLYGSASFSSSNENGTVIDVGEGGEVLYFSYWEGQKLPIEIRGENATITVLPSESPVSQETPKASYASSIWTNPTFVTVSAVTVSAPADLIATSTGSTYGYVVYANSQLYHTPQVTVVAFSGAINLIDELPSSVVDQIASFATDLRNTRQAAKSSMEAAEEAAPVVRKALGSIRLCKAGKIPVPCLK